MAENLQIVAFENGTLRRLSGRGDSKEAVLALPLSRLIARLVKVPADADPVGVATPLLQSMSPFPDEPLTVSCETVREDETERVVIAAALPENAADDIGEALDAEKLSVVRIDSLALGLLRGVWNALGESSGRRIVLQDSPDCLSCVVLDGDQPFAIRAITDRTDLRREVMLSLLEAEDFGGARKLEEIVVVEADKSGEAESFPLQNEDDPSIFQSGKDSASPLNEDPFNVLAALAPLRTITVGSDAALVGVAERATDEAGLNAIPESWREFLEETRFKAKLIKYLAIAGGIWLLIMAILFGVPMVYGFMTNHQKSLSKRHQRQYMAVKEMKAKVDLIHKYSDHARGALEIMKALSDRLPGGITLSSWSYRREDGVHVSGDSESDEDVFKLKDEMDALADGEDGEGERIFGTVNLNGPSSSKGGYRFDLDCQYQKEEEE